MALDSELHGVIVPPVSKEFLDRLIEAFPRKRFSLDATIEEVQRAEGKQDVIDWIIHRVGAKS